MSDLMLMHRQVMYRQWCQAKDLPIDDSEDDGPLGAHNWMDVFGGGE